MLKIKERLFISEHTIQYNVVISIVNHITIGTGILSPTDTPKLVPTLAQDTINTSVIVNFSIMLYYTQEVEDNVADIGGFFDQMLAETNQGKWL